jgi:hypothetical protein
MVDAAKARTRGALALGALLVLIPSALAFPEEVSALLRVVGFPLAAFGAYGLGTELGILKGAGKTAGKLVVLSAAMAGLPLLCGALLEIVSGPDGGLGDAILYDLFLIPASFIAGAVGAGFWLEWPAPIFSALGGITFLFHSPADLGLIDLGARPDSLARWLVDSSGEHFIFAWTALGALAGLSIDMSIKAAVDFARRLAR